MGFPDTLRWPNLSLFRILSSLRVFGLPACQPCSVFEACLRSACCRTATQPTETACRGQQGSRGRRSAEQLSARTDTCDPMANLHAPALPRLHVVGLGLCEAPVPPELLDRAVAVRILLGIGTGKVGTQPDISALQSRLLAWTKPSTPGDARWELRA